MKTLTFIKFYIIDALKVLYPSIELGKPRERVRDLVPEDFECKNCASCPYYKWERRQTLLDRQFDRQFGR